MLFGCLEVVQDGKNEQSPTKAYRDRFGFHAFGIPIALASNSLPSAKARLASDLPPAAVDYTLTSER